MASALERDEGKKEELKEISSTFDVRSRETTATILLARKREANILKMIALQLSCLQRLQKRNGKYNDEKQHLGQLGSHSKAMALVIKCGWHDIWSHLRKSS